MRIIKIPLIAALSVLFVSACVSTDPAARGTFIPGAEVAERLKSNSKVAWAERDERGYAEFYPDGTAIADYGNGKERGRWFVKDDAVCIAFADSIWVGDLCGLIYHTGGVNYAVYHAEDGNYLAKFRF